MSQSTKETLSHKIYHNQAVNYDRFRNADPLIVKELLALFNSKKQNLGSVLDIGCGFW
ncbi:hypothetical protein AB751O23_AB_00040 [Chlamydiales bacterium SCGC AB-751-O23]|jgi:hypothetical protein|nr:hypothetical protein AB751O23_AB_00040 [Chlamydiales bacterium SCGC AB-751-O23]